MRVRHNLLADFLEPAHRRVILATQHGLLEFRRRRRWEALPVVIVDLAKVDFRVRIYFGSRLFRCFLEREDGQFWESPKLTIFEDVFKNASQFRAAMADFSIDL